MCRVNQKCNFSPSEVEYKERNAGQRIKRERRTLKSHNNMAGNGKS